MDEARWNTVIGVNLLAPQRITEQLVAKGALQRGRPRHRRLLHRRHRRQPRPDQLRHLQGRRHRPGRGHARMLADEEDHRSTPWHPGFIETAMTAAIPFATREAGRRMSSLLQGGQTVDVAETVAYFASPASNAVTGQIRPRLRPEPAGGLMARELRQLRSRRTPATCICGRRSVRSRCRCSARPQRPAAGHDAWRSKGCASIRTTWRPTTRRDRAAVRRHAADHVPVHAGVPGR